jgi:hypothetical protein
MTVHLTTKNILPVIVGVCVLGLAIIPLSVPPEHLTWLRWELAIIGLGVLAVIGLFWQAAIQSREDHEREAADKKRDERQQNIESLLLKLSTGSSVTAVSEPMSQPIKSVESDAMAGSISAKYVRASLVNHHPFATFVRDIYRAARQEDKYTEACDFLFEVHLVNKGLPTTVQKIVCEAKRNNQWEKLPLVEDLDEYEIEFPDELVDNPHWLGGQREKIKALEPNLAKELLHGKALEKGIGHQGWVRFSIELTKEEIGKPIEHRVKFVDAFDVEHPVVLIEPLLMNGRIIHSPKVWSERLRSS